MLFRSRGDMEKNMEKAKDYCAYAASCGVIPLAPHTIFTQYLNDAVPEQREQGLRMGHELLERCDELWVMGDTISQGMKDEIGLATFLQLPILYVSDDMVKNQKMIRQSDRPLDINDCIPESSQYNYENQFLVLKPGVSSKGKDMTADDSIWYARNGFGCIYGARGQAVYAESLLTGKYIHWERHDFCGIVKPESLKEWLLDKPVRNEAAEELTKFVHPKHFTARNCAELYHRCPKLQHHGFRFPRQCDRYIVGRGQGNVSCRWGFSSDRKSVV